MEESKNEKIETYQNGVAISCLSATCTLAN